MGEIGEKTIKSWISQPLVYNNHIGILTQKHKSISSKSLKHVKCPDPYFYGVLKMGRKIPNIIEAAARFPVHRIHS
jgi:hypothetical protein